MKTDDLIALLAAGEGPVQRHALARRLALAVLGGALGAVLMTVALYGVRADLALVAHTPQFWAKLALPGSVALLALWLTQRLARPGVKGGALWGLLGLPLLLVWLGGCDELARCPRGCPCRVDPGAHLAHLRLEHRLAVGTHPDCHWLGAAWPGTHSPASGGRGGRSAGRCHGYPCLLPALPGNGGAVLGALVCAGHAGAGFGGHLARATPAALVTEAALWPCG